jgi:hypothetical protein
MTDRAAIPVWLHVVVRFVLCALLAVTAHAADLTSTPVESATPTPVTPTSTQTPTCAPTGTPYCSDTCVPCPTIRPNCYASACGACIQNPTCAGDTVCVPSNTPYINGCCTCATVTPTPSGAGTPIVTPTPILCTGDCHDDSQVTVDEILTMVNIALGNLDVSSCQPGDANDDNQVTIDEILTAVNNALNGC